MSFRDGALAPDLRCAIAHRGISRFRARCVASPRNDGLNCLPLSRALFERPTKPYISLSSKSASDAPGSRMTTLLLTHPACLDHATPPGHPERPDRVRAVAKVLGEDRFDKLARGEAPEGNLDLVTLCHDEHYVGELRRIAPDSGLVYLDGDTSM